ncbi:MAG: hypothetical protein SH856_08285 [Flavobacteriales bacterium]|nr:hypothetical protein [Flavobacteriales bacterium]
METTEKNMGHEESLRLIERTIASARNKFADDGFHFLLWGVLVILASLACYWLAMINYEKNYLPWLIMPAIGAPLAIIYEIRKSKTASVRTSLDTYYHAVWMGFGVTLFAVIFFSVRHNLSPISFILAVTGLATFVSGRIFRFGPLTCGGFVFWIAAFIATFIDEGSQLLLNAGATLLGYIIPGTMLWKKAKEERHVSAP